MQTKWLLLLLPVFLMGFEKPKEYLITAQITGFPDSTLFYLKNMSTDENIDSAYIVNNSFQMKGHVSLEPSQLWLNTTWNDGFYYTFLFIGNEKITIEANLTDFPYDVRVNGSKTQDEYIVLNTLTKSYSIKRNELLDELFSLPPEIMQEKSAEIWLEVSQIDQITDEITLEFVKTYPNTYAALMSMNQIKNKIPKDSLRYLFNQVSPELQSSPYGKIIAIFLKEKISEVGDPAHDFTAQDVNGNTFTFSNTRGKYILLDFSSSFCLPCIQSIEELYEVHQTYGNSLEIITFSVDAKKSTWLQSIKRDSLPWKNVWDGNGSFGETCIKYGVQGYPTFFIISPEGIILDRWSGYGKGLILLKLEPFNIR
ncbi:MAG: AhpC/TSA family protein [Flavobacteriales bacterium]|nr:AhpC/TSA family protein [Flavobacteriales bacterium]